jgi:Recombination endonuclease VII
MLPVINDKRASALSAAPCAGSAAVWLEQHGGSLPRTVRDSAMSAVDPAKSNRTYRISRYGLTREQVDRLLEVQGYACAMCREPFDERQLIHVDHDHACCPERNRSCGKCVRGLLCAVCNISLGHIERRYDLARAYLDNPAWQFVVRAA